MDEISLQAFKPEIPMLSDRSSQLAPQKSRQALSTDSGEPSEISFRESMQNFIGDVDSMQKDAGKKIQGFMAGEISDVHDVMIAVEKASTSFQLLMELRNQFLDAYQEIKRMPV